MKKKNKSDYGRTKSNTIVEDEPSFAKRDNYLILGRRDEEKVQTQRVEQEQDEVFFDNYIAFHHQDNIDLEREVIEERRSLLSQHRKDPAEMDPGTTESQVSTPSDTSSDIDFMFSSTISPSDTKTEPPPTKTKPPPTKTQTNPKTPTDGGACSKKNKHHKYCKCKKFSARKDHPNLCNCGHSLTHHKSNTSFV